ncbi:transcription termination/antitermination protein NusG [Rhodoflexus caldus]|jgi:transcriptional antiterminator NusG|uniref:transcription termination/antitermination protein NusG n=1 Tax=Rhodoflexus caldus TaxID=2891236 RepID=UPI00202A7736|nr:transcription termination/antitermination protein NusG [Rhodoflexus caldus]
MSDSKLDWYLLRVVSGQEKKVKSYLEKEVAIHNLGEYISQVLTPSEKVYQIRKMKDGKSKKVAVEKNFFPGYVFVQANLSNGEIIHTIKSVPGVINFLDVEGAGPNAQPRPMRESEINRILGKIDDTDESEIKHDISFHVGETVKVMDGPFNGFTGTVEEVFEEKKKLNVMVKIFGRNTPVELNYMQVSKEL